MRQSLPNSQISTGALAAEAVLVARAKADPAAFGEIYRLHYRSVVACIHRRLGNVHASEDLAAEVFIAAYRSIGRYRPSAVPLRHWLLRIATNTVNRWLRRQQRSAWTLALVRRASATASTGDRGYGPHAHAPGERLAVLLRRLPVSQQAVVSLHYFEGLSVEEAAGALGCSAGTVKSRLARARDRLKELIEGEAP